MKEKSVLNSKKFAAFFVSLAVIAGVLVVALVYRTQMNVWTSVFASIGMLAICSLAIGYILGQAGLDKFLSSVKEVVYDKKDLE